MNKAELPVDDYNADNFPMWKAHKKVRAFKIGSIGTPADSLTKRLIVPVNEAYPSVEVDAIFVQIHKVEPGWYFVIYPDGYKSASPAQAFEEGYTLMLEPPKASEKPWEEYQTKKFEESILTYRYGHCIVGISLIEDAVYDKILYQARQIIHADSPIHKPASKNAEDYSGTIKSWYEMLIVYAMQKHGHLKRMSEPSMQEFNFALYINSLVTDDVLFIDDYRKIAVIAAMKFPSLHQVLLQDLVMPEGLTLIKQALKDATLQYLEQKKASQNAGT